MRFIILIRLQERYLEDGKNVFKLRLKLCSSLYPINERIRDFFLEYDRHMLGTGPPWGSELLEVLTVALISFFITQCLQIIYVICIAIFECLRLLFI